MKGEGELVTVDDGGAISKQDSEVTSEHDTAELMWLGSLGTTSAGEPLLLSLNVVPEEHKVAVVVVINGHETDSIFGSVVLSWSQELLTSGGLFRLVHISVVAMIDAEHDAMVDINEVGSTKPVFGWSAELGLMVSSLWEPLLLPLNVVVAAVSEEEHNAEDLVAATELDVDDSDEVAGD